MIDGARPLPTPGFGVIDLRTALLSRPSFGRLLSVTVLVVVASVACGSSDEGPVSLGHSEVGPEPFVTVAVVAPSDELTAALDDAASAADEAEATPDDSSDEDPDAAADEAVRLDTRTRAATARLSEAGIASIRPADPAGAAVVAVGSDDVCNIDALVDELTATDATATAFADVAGIEATGIEAYLQSLTAGYLVDDTPVVNHSPGEDGAMAFDAILEAGTPILVDANGIPRVRCQCGNPLLPARVDLGGRVVDSRAFADRVVEAVIGDDVPDETSNPTDGTFTNSPDDAIGPPDRIAVALGDDPDAEPGRCRFRVVVEFVDNRLVDRPGTDLQVVELGRAESTFVSVGTSLDDLRAVGEVHGGTDAIDITAVAEPGDEFRFVQLCDGPDTASTVPGSDVDAVAALHSVPVD